MRTPSYNELNHLERLDLLRAIRNWSATLGIVAIALAVMTVRNTVANPETWASAFNALAASGTFTQYAGWLAGFGLLLLILAFLLALYVGKAER
jgi:hypothetical protein